jgi:hypothetical protein
MRIYFLFISLLLFSFCCNGQQIENEKLKRWLISGSVGGAPLPGTPATLLPGIEFFVTPRLSLFNEIALQTAKNKDYDSTALNKKYFKYKAEARYYFLKKAKKVLPYFAMQYTKAQRSFDVGKNWTYYEAAQKDSIYSYTRASINSPVQTIALQFGLAIKGYGNFYIDLAAGFGVRATNTTYSNVQGLQKIRNRQLVNIVLASTYRYIGQLSRLQLNMNFRISYRF